MNALLLSRSMSTSGNLPSLNPDELFVKHTVSEIKQVQQQLRNDADAKQEELRLMVGERYRDLLQASTSIISISESAKRVEQALENAQDTIKAQGVPPLPRKTSASGAVDTQLQTFQLLSAHIKLLLDAPEHLWRLLEKKKYLPAAWFFLLSRVVQRALLRNDDEDEGWNNYGIDVQEEFPIVQRQWEVVSQFRSQILHKATLSLQDYTSTVEDTCATLLALHLLDTRPLSDALAAFTAQRAKALHILLASLSKFSQPNGTSTSEAAPPTLRQLRQLLQTCFALMAETVKTARRIFLDDGKQSSLLRAIMQDTQSDVPDANDTSTLPPSLRLNTQSVLQALPSASHLLHLPQNLKQYKPYIDITSPATFVHSTHLASVLEKWLSTSVENVEAAASKWFTNINSAKDVWNIRSSIREWLIMLENLGNKEMELLTRSLDGICQQRVVDIWKTTLAKAEKEVRTIIPTNLAASSSQSTAEFDKSSIANLFHPPPLPALPSKSLTVNDTPLSKYQSAICDRLVGRTALQDAVLRVLENCVRSLQQDLTFISAAAAAESTDNTQALKETFQSEAETLCSTLLGVLVTSSSDLREDDTDGLVFLVQLTSALASSSSFPSSVLLPKSSLEDFRKKTEHIHAELAERWRNRALEGMYQLMSPSASCYLRTPSSPKGPSPSLIQALTSLVNAVTTVNLSYHETTNTTAAVRSFVERFLSQIADQADPLPQFIWDTEFLAQLLGAQGEVFNTLAKDVRATRSRLSEKVENGPTQDELEQGCTDCLARAQVLITPLMAENADLGVLSRHGISSSEATLPMSVARPSGRFALVLVEEAH